MGIRENKVEKYLDQKIIELGGITRKWVSPGRDGVPDRIVIYGKGYVEVVFTEVKTNDGTMSVAQEREHKILIDHGQAVTTVYGNRGVDAFIADLKLAYHNEDIKREYR